MLNFNFTRVKLVFGDFLMPFWESKMSVHFLRFLIYIFVFLVIFLQDMLISLPALLMTIEYALNHGFQLH